MPKLKQKYESVINMDIKIVVDSSADILALNNVPLEVAPLKITTDTREFIDNKNLNVYEMVEFLNSYKGKSFTACPSVGDWIEAFGNAKRIFCITITSGLSGSYNSAIIAKEQYEKQNPDAKVFIIDSLSAGPKLKLIAEELEKLILSGAEYEDICTKISDYLNNIGTIFVLESLKNLANNGRVSYAKAKIAGVLGIRALGTASKVGKIELLNKARGDKRTQELVLGYLEEMNYNGKTLSISHCFNGEAANRLKDLIIKKFPKAKISIQNTLGLCSFYAERKGLILGFEKTAL